MTRRRTGGLTLLLAAVALLTPSVANGAPPVITAAYNWSDPGIIVVNWTLPAGMTTWTFELATSPDTVQSGDLKGSFPTDHRLAYQLLWDGGVGPGPTSWMTEIRLPGGTYYVHVSAFGSCATPLAASCTKEYSAPVAVVVPPQPPPNLTSAAQSARHLTASFTTGEFMASDYIEAATSPDVYPDGPDKGAFLNENTILIDPLSVANTNYQGNVGSYQSSVTLPGGIYYVHVAGLDTGCYSPNAPRCSDQFSNILSVLVPSQAPTLTSAGQSAGHVRATWDLPAGMEASFIEVARAPDVDTGGLSSGPFLTRNVVTKSPLYADQRAYSAAVQLPPGTYYLHVADFAPSGCPTPDASTCVDEFSETRPVTVPGASATPPPSLPPAAPRKVVAFASLRVPSTQSVARLYVQAGMAEAGTITAGGTVSAPNRASVLKFKTVSAPAVVGRIVKLRLKLAKRALKLVTRALRHHRKLKANITITATDKSGNSKSEKRAVNLKL